MWLVWGHELGEAGFQGILRAERPLLSSLMTSRLWQCCIQCTGTGEGSTGEQWIAKALLYRENLYSALTRTMSPCQSLVPPVYSLIGTGAQSEQVHYHENPLADMAPLRGICHCHCHRLCLTQPLETEQPHVLAPSYILLLQSDFLDFFLVYGLFIWIPGDFSLLLLLVSITTLIWSPEG
uniref:Uncharacterized protein n=1 Tax=Rousettus aegyptiacus TaxID=9407 RepID=A0A7J8JID5_ROUAE|nr:hypothetical protein HJG63_010187 [Rousettus aegyptiacus]